MSDQCPLDQGFPGYAEVKESLACEQHRYSYPMYLLLLASSSRPHNVRNNVRRDARTFSTAIVRVQCLPVGPQPRFCTLPLYGVVSGHSAVHFLTLQLPKVLRTWGILCILTWNCASRHNAVHFFISLLARWLRAHRFSEPTVWPSRITNHRKT